MIERPCRHHLTSHNRHETPRAEKARKEKESRKRRRSDRRSRNHAARGQSSSERSASVVSSTIADIAANLGVDQETPARLAASANPEHVVPSVEVHSFTPNNGPAAEQNVKATRVNSRVKPIGETQPLDGTTDSRPPMTQVRQSNGLFSTLGNLFGIRGPNTPRYPSGPQARVQQQQQPVSQARLPFGSSDAESSASRSTDSS